ncbi:MAG TPA: hypothetical protein VFI45_11980 [Candidatus Acidoferrum sp.]|nr:hypothetical protein [Candidatus Acidoferrum sp.]
MPGLGISVRLLLRFAVLSCSIAFLPLLAQEQSPIQPGAHEFHADLMSAGAQSYTLQRPRSDFFTLEKPLWTSSPGTIQRMESAFYCNDTPFVDQVRLPLATFWHGRVKLIGFESDVTTANFVMGLPGQGALHNLSAFGGNGFLAVHTPPSDQLAGINMTFSWHGTQAEPGDSSGLHGIEHLVRVSRNFLPFLATRSDSYSSALP